MYEETLDQLEFINSEFDKCVSFWSKTNLLNGIEDEHIRRVVSVMMTNQELFSKSSSTEDDRKFGIPLMRLLFGGKEKDPELYDMISIQPMLGPVSPVIVTATDGDAIIGEDISAKSKLFRIKGELTIDNLNKQFYVYLLNDIINDIRKNVNSSIKISLRDIKEIEGLKLEIASKVNRIFFPKLRERADVLIAGKFWIASNVCYRENLSGLNFDRFIFMDELPLDTITIGFKGEKPYQSGYKRRRKTMTFLQRKNAGTDSELSVARRTKVPALGSWM